MLDDEEWISILIAVLEATESGSLNWDYFEKDRAQTLNRTPTLTASVGEKTVYRIWSEDGDGRLPYRFSILRRTTRDLEPESIAAFGTSTFNIGDASVSDYVYDLYNAASRDATGASRIVSTLLSELSDLSKD